MIERKILMTKEFMRSFLTTELWDDWQLCEASITGAVTWTVDGRVNRAYYGEDGAGEMPAGEYMPWAQIRPVVLSIIKGKHTPLLFRFLLTPPETDGGEDAQAYSAEFVRVCRIRFADGHIYIASAVDMKQFSLDKEPERKWDEALSRFLDTHYIDYEEL